MRWVSVVALLLASASSSAFQDRRLVREPTATDRRVALVIGNNAYPGVPLANGVNDARAVAAALRDLRFEVRLVADATAEASDREIAQFASSVHAGDIALFYFSGHGVQVDGENYLVPVDYRGEDEIALKRRAIALGEVHERLHQQGARVIVLILDACRDNPYRRSRSASGGLAPFDAQGTLVAFATGPGSTASDNPGAVNGLFTQHLLKALLTPGIGASELFRQVRRAVVEASGGRQFPWLSDGLVGDFLFRPGPAPSAAGEDLARKEELLFWESIKDGRNRRWFEEYLTRYGDTGRFSILARARVQELSGPPPAEHSGAPAVVNPPATPPAVRIGRSEIAAARGVSPFTPDKNLLSSMVKTSESMSPGTPQSGSLPAIWRNDFLKAQGGKIYVPFTLVVDPGNRQPSDLVVYYSAVSAGATVRKPAYEDILQFRPPAVSGPFRLNASMTLPPGDYDVSVVARELTGAGAEPRTVKIAQRLAVPDFWSRELATSSVILCSRIDPLSAPLSSNEVRTRPYALGTMEIVPALNTTFRKSDEVQTFLLVYNPGLDRTGKPDVRVEYAFYAVTGSTEKYFNKTNPQLFNASTLPATFDPAAGHQVQAGQAVPLSSFSAGEYRLEITAIDHVTSQRVVRSVRFMVEP